MTNHVNRDLTLQASVIAHQPLEFSEEELEGVAGPSNTWRRYRRDFLYTAAGY